MLPRERGLRLILNLGRCGHGGLLAFARKGGYFELNLFVISNVEGRSESETEPLVSETSSGFERTAEADIVIKTGLDCLATEGHVLS